MQVWEWFGDGSEHVSNLSLDLTAAGSGHEAMSSNGTNTVKMWMDRTASGTTATVGQRDGRVGGVADGGRCRRPWLP